MLIVVFARCSAKWLLLSGSGPEAVNQACFVGVAVFIVEQCGVVGPPCIVEFVVDGWAGFAVGALEHAFANDCNLGGPNLLDNLRSASGQGQ